MNHKDHLTQSGFGEFLESVPDAMMLVDTRGVIVAANGLLEELFGYGPGELLGQKIEVLIPSRFAGHHVGQRESYAKKPNRRSMGVGMHLSGVRKDGQEFPVEVSLGPVSINDEKYVSAAVRDVSERLRIEKLTSARKEQLYHAQKLEALGALVAGVAHDFNNLVFVIQSSAEMARLSMVESGPATEALERIQEAADQAKGVTKSLLTFTHKAASVKEPLEISQVVKAARRILKDTLPAKIEFIVNTPTTAVWIDGDVTQLLQVLLNLTINARDAMPQGGELRISITTEKSGGGEFVVLSVSDTGTGIEPSKINHIFEPYFTTKGRQSGTGLGLAISQGIIEDHGGTIRVASVVGKETSFIIRLPRLLEMRSSGFIEAFPRLADVSSGVALVAEDNELVRGAIAGMLDVLGYEVVLVGDGQDALDAFDQKPEFFDLLILDLDMPHVGGIECLCTIRDQGQQIAAVLVHGAATLPEFSSGMANTPVLHKPFSVDDLRQCIEAARGGVPARVG